MEEKIVIGEVLKPQGILGELKIKPYTDNAERYKALKNVFIGEKEYDIIKVKVSPEAVYLAVKGIADRNGAELLRGQFLKVLRENAVSLPQNNYFIVDVIGSMVVTDEGKEIGEVTDIQPSRQDIYTLKLKNGKRVMFPLLKDVLVKIDTKNKVVTVKSKRFFEVAVYED